MAKADLWRHTFCTPQGYGEATKEERNITPLSYELHDKAHHLATTTIF